MKSVVAMRVAFVCAFVFGPQFSNSRTLGQIKEWHFKAPHGVITLKLSSQPNANGRRTVLSLEPEAGFVPTVTEEADAISRILNEMTSLGYDPRKMEMITTWLQNTPYQKGVERSVAESGTWKSCLGQKYCHEAETTADRYLRSVDAFNSFDDTLQAHGLKRRWVRVDDMAVGEVDHRLMCNGLIVIALNEGD